MESEQKAKMVRQYDELLDLALEHQSVDYYRRALDQPNTGKKREEVLI